MMQLPLVQRHKRSGRLLHTRWGIYNEVEVRSLLQQRWLLEDEAQHTLRPDREFQFHRPDETLARWLTRRKACVSMEPPPCSSPSTVGPQGSSRSPTR